MQRIKGPFDDMQQQKITIFRKNKMHHAEKKVYNISNTGWICAPFPRNGAHINELAFMLKKRPQ
jgi:hypothetical protein